MLDVCKRTAPSKRKPTKAELMVFEKAKAAATSEELKCGKLVVNLQASKKAADTPRDKFQLSASAEQYCIMKGDMPRLLCLNMVRTRKKYVHLCLNMVRSKAITQTKLTND